MSEPEDEIGALLAADLAYANEEFTFTFTRAEVSSIVASVQVCRLTLSGTARSLCRSVLARIASNEAYQASKKKVPPRADS
jgi:hypothetical protein